MVLQWLWSKMVAGWYSEVNHSVYWLETAERYGICIVLLLYLFSKFTWLWWYRISTVFVIYVWKYKWCSGKPKAVRVRLNNNDSVAKQPKRRITLDTAQQYHGFGKLWQSSFIRGQCPRDTFGDTTGENQQNLLQNSCFVFCQNHLQLMRVCCSWG